MPERLRGATAEDRARVHALLEASELPLAGLAPDLEGFVVAEDDGELVGVAGLEVYGDDGLIRSVAVSPGRRGEGTGARLAERIVADARGAGLARLYLLTTTAEGWFARRGFRSVTRDAVPEGVRASVEFREACPASAAVMVRDLG